MIVDPCKYNSRERGMIFRYAELSVRKLRGEPLSEKESNEMAQILRNLNLSHEKILDLAATMTMEPECSG